MLFEIVFSKAPIFLFKSTLKVLVNTGPVLFVCCFKYMYTCILLHSCFHDTAKISFTYGSLLLYFSIFTNKYMSDLQ